jgi:hypothetical protein
LGAALLGLAVLLRLHTAVIAACMVAVVAARRRSTRDAMEFAAILASLALALGAIDRLTWGDWFHSTVVYVKANLLQDVASSYGTAPPSFYVRAICRTWGWTAAPMIGLATLGARRAPSVAVTVAAFVLLHSVVPHKELRFVLPVLGLLCALAGRGACTVLDWLARRRAAVAFYVAIGIALVASSVRAERVTFAQIGGGMGGARATPVYDFQGPVNRLLWAAHDVPDLCGLRVPYDLTTIGGVSYLHRRISVYGTGNPDRNGHANYEIVSGEGPGVASDGGLTLRRIASTCTPDTEYRWRAN